MSIVSVAIAGTAFGYDVLADIGVDVVQIFGEQFRKRCIIEDEKIDRSELRYVQRLVNWYFFIFLFSRLGDHIIVPPQLPNYDRLHHGVYLGKRNGVDVVTDFGAVNEEQQIRELDEFIGNYSNELYHRIYDYKEVKLLPFEYTVKYAMIICESIYRHLWPKISLNTNISEIYASLLTVAYPFSQRLPQELFYKQIYKPHKEKNILEMCEEVANEVKEFLKYSVQRDNKEIISDDENISDNSN